jgi:hypothetical protein
VTVNRSMDFFDQGRAQRPPRPAAPAGYEDGPPPYDEYAPYGEIGTESVRGTGPAGPRGRGRLAGAVTGLLGAAVATGVANLTAAFIRPQASPVTAVGGAFLAHAPAVLRPLGAGRPGGNHGGLLLLSLYAAIALIAMAIGVLAWRRAGLAAAWTGLLSLIEGYAALTRPGGRATDAIPSVIGGLAAVAVIIGLVRAGTRPDGGEPSGYGDGDYGADAYRADDYRADGYGAGDYPADEHAAAGYAAGDYAADDYAADGGFDFDGYAPGGYETADAYGAFGAEPAGERPPYREGWPA